jgi:hypothetical protein
MMGFKEYWPLYLRAHRQPATRACHYVATGAGISAGLIALFLGAPSIFIVTVGICYLVAIASHRYIERNRPMILINPLWGAMADLRMTWLAVSGGLRTEFARHDTDATFGIDLRSKLWVARYAPFLLSGAGLSAGLADLQDLVDPAARLVYPALQLGAPVAVFAVALAAAWTALLVDRIEARGRPTAAATRVARRSARLAALTATLRRTAVCLSAVGASVFAAGEIFEYGGLW